MRNTKRPYAVIALAILFFMPGISRAECPEECYDGEPTIVELSGFLYKKTFPGPPNYESVEKGDRAETQLLLKLDGPICATVTSQVEAWIKYIIRDVKDITLVLYEKGIYKEEYLNSRVTVSGMLWEAHTGHHRTPLLITVKGIRSGSPEPLTSSIEIQ